jgi:hypothetical protein
LPIYLIYNPQHSPRPAMSRVFYCLQFGGHNRPVAARSLKPWPTYCRGYDRGLCAILAALFDGRARHACWPTRAPMRPPAHVYARPCAPARIAWSLPFCFNSCRQTLPFFAGGRSDFFGRQTLSFFAGRRSLISLEPFWAVDFPLLHGEALIY